MDLSLDKIVHSLHFDGMLVILTGGAGGLAFVISRALIAQGSDVALVDTNLERTKAEAEKVTNWAAKELKGSKEPIGEVSAWVCDIGDPESAYTTCHNLNVDSGYFCY